MAVSEPPSGKTGVAPFGLRQVVVNSIEGICAECNRFMEWQYREIIRGEPSAEQREKHRRELMWALRTAKLLECVASDPDSASPSPLALLKAKVSQLERSWKMLYEPIPQEEADQILAEIFPDESRTGTCGMVILRFDTSDEERRALGWLAGRFSFQDLGQWRLDGA